jgi:SAM-dependent methyltransferase
VPPISEKWAEPDSCANHVLPVHPTQLSVVIWPRELSRARYFPRMEEHTDAYGQLILAYLEGRARAREIVERDDGFIEATDGPAGYFAPVRRWAPAERQGLRFVRGRVLDAGCGAGRVALELQARGREVVAIDISPAAVDVARRRGVLDARVLAFENVGAELGRFDTVVMYGNNFGLFGGEAKARRLLRRLRPMAGRIVASSRNPYETMMRRTLRIRSGTGAAGGCQASCACASVTAITPHPGSTI